MKANITTYPRWSSKVDYYQKTSDQTVNNSIVLVDDNTFQFVVPAGGGFSGAIFWGEIFLELNSPLAADFRFNFGVPNVGDLIYWRALGAVGGTIVDVTGDGSADQRLDTDSMTLKLIPFYFYPGSAATQTNGGLLIFRWAQWTATVANTTLYSGSCWARLVRAYRY